MSFGPDCKLSGALNTPLGWGVCGAAFGSRQSLGSPAEEPGLGFAVSSREVLEIKFEELGLTGATGTRLYSSGSSCLSGKTMQTVGCVLLPEKPAAQSSGHHVCGSVQCKQCWQCRRVLATGTHLSRLVNGLQPDKDSFLQHARILQKNVATGKVAQERLLTSQREPWP